MKLKALFGLVMLAVVVVAGVALVGCGGGGSGWHESGTLRVVLTDMPGGYASVWIAIREVRVLPAGQAGGAVTSGLPIVAAFDPPLRINVLDLAFQQQVLGTSTVPVGSYEQVRLVLEANPAVGDPVNYVTHFSAPSVKVPLEAPSGQQSGLKIVGRFEVEPRVINTIALDFDPSRAIVSAGNSGQLNFKPSGIRMMTLAGVWPTYGTIAGTVNPTSAWPSAKVLAIPQGSTLPLAAGIVDPADGSFRLLLPPGNYYLTISANGFANYKSSLLSPPSFFTVSMGADNDIGTLSLTP